MAENLAVQHGATLRDLMEKSKAAFAAVLPKHVTYDRLFKITLNCVARTKLLRECSPISIVRSMMQAAELGLEPGSALGDAYLVPYRQKHGGYEAQFIPGYRGLVRIALEEKLCVKVDAVVVRAGDGWTFAKGSLPPKPIHTPLPFSDAEPIGFYVVVTLPGGEKKWETMSVAQINKIRDRATFRDREKKGPWFTDYEEMAKKTVWKRLAKYLGIRPSSMLGKALDADDAAEADEDLPPVDLDIVGGADSDTVPGNVVKDEKPQEPKPSAPPTDLAGAKKALEERRTNPNQSELPPGVAAIRQKDAERQQEPCAKTEGCVLAKGHKGFCKGKLPDAKLPPVEPPPEKKSEIEETIARAVATGDKPKEPAAPAACDACGMVTGHVPGCPEGGE